MNATQVKHPQTILGFSADYFGVAAPFGDGITEYNYEQFLQEVQPFHILAQRNGLESNLSVRQALPCAAIEQKREDGITQFWLFQRTNKVGEARLGGKVACFWGGHVDGKDAYFNEKSVLDLGATLVAGRDREQGEEYRMYDPADKETDVFFHLTPANLFIANSTVEVDKYHVAIIYTIKLPMGYMVDVLEDELIGMEPMSAQEALDAHAEGKIELESWALIYMNYVRAKELLDSGAKVAIEPMVDNVTAGDTVETFVSVHADAGSMVINVEAVPDQYNTAPSHHSLYTSEGGERVENKSYMDTTVDKMKEQGEWNVPAVQDASMVVDLSEGNTFSATLDQDTKMGAAPLTSETPVEHSPAFQQFLDSFEDFVDGLKKEHTALHSRWSPEIVKYLNTWFGDMDDDERGQIAHNLVFTRVSKTLSDKTDAFVTNLTDEERIVAYEMLNSRFNKETQQDVADKVGGYADVLDQVNALTDQKVASAEQALEWDNGPWYDAYVARDGKNWNEFKQKIVMMFGLVGSVKVWHTNDDLDASTEFPKEAAQYPRLFGSASGNHYTVGQMLGLVDAMGVPEFKAMTLIHVDFDENMNQVGAPYKKVFGVDIPYVGDGSQFLPDMRVDPDQVDSLEPKEAKVPTGTYASFQENLVLGLVTQQVTDVKITAVKAYVELEYNGFVEVIEQPTINRMKTLSRVRDTGEPIFEFVHKLRLSEGTFLPDGQASKVLAMVMGDDIDNIGYTFELTGLVAPGRPLVKVNVQGPNLTGMHSKAGVTHVEGINNVSAEVIERVNALSVTIIAVDLAAVPAD